MNDFNLLATIETTVLVAVWNTPVIFQGYFKIILPNKASEYFIFYRCNCEDYEQHHFRDQEFIPDNVEFTHLYNSLGIMHRVNQIEDDALYLLKYALFITVNQMLCNSKYYPTYIDEIALSSLIDRTKVVIHEPFTAKTHEDLGFAVAMEFQPINNESSKALLALLHLTE